MSSPNANVTEILKRLKAGDADAKEELFHVVYAELRKLARMAMSKERENHTLQPTGLVHEAYLQLMGEALVDFENSLHFFAVASRTMRRILVDHARRVRTKKRFGGHKVELDDNLALSPQKAESFLQLELALEELEKLYPRQAQVVELRYFCGLNFDEIGQVLELSSRTAKRDWEFARAWLHSKM